MIFVDTSIWYAAHVSEDPAHPGARQLLRQATSDLITTDYVVDELLTLLIARQQRDVAVRIGDGFWSQSTCKLHWADKTDVLSAWEVFKSFDDKSWSFTDCVSYSVMSRLGISQALALDEHFRQFGFLVVKP